MPCPDENELSAFAQGRLPAPHAEEIDRHIDACPACRTLVVELMRSTASAARADDSPELAQGAKLDRYLIVGCLGAGGMGVVYAAFDPELDRKVAIKLLHVGRVSSAEAKERLMREARAMARLSHPNILAVHDVGTVGNRVFLALELVEGGSLSQWLSERPRSRREILAAFRAAGEGLAAAHAAGIVHRDFKPDNVLVGRDGRVRVTDFGLARPLGDETEPAGPGGAGSLASPLTQTGVAMGTPAFMAPEQFEGKRADARSDQFSFCVSLYQALCGVRPFAGATPAELRASVLDGQVQPAARGAATPAWLRRVLLRGLARDPAQRFPSLEALLAALGRDPAIARRRWLWGALAAAIATAAVLGYRAQAEHRRGLCQGAQQHLAGVWDAARREALHRSFQAAGGSFAEDAFRGASGSLDDYASGWVSMRTEACAATRLRGEQSEEMLSRRMACLDRRLGNLASAVDVLEKADRGVVERAVQVAHGLASIKGCADIAALLSQVKLPDDLATRRAVEELRPQLSRAAALTDAGKYSTSIEISTEIARRGRELRYRPLVAEALYAQGTTLLSMGSYREAAPVLTEAAFTAAAVGDDPTAAQAALRRLQVTSFSGESSSAEMGALWRDYSLAAIERAGSDPVLTGNWTYAHAQLLFVQGRIDEAIAEGEKSFALLSRALGPTHPRLATIQTGLGTMLRSAGQLESALKKQRSAVALREEKLGPAHPETGKVLTSLAICLYDLRRYDEALEVDRRSLRILEEALGPESHSAGMALTNLGDVEMRLGRYADAMAHFQRASTLFEKIHGPQHRLVAGIGVEMGTCLRLSGRPLEAVALHERAVAALEKVGYAKDELFVDALAALGADRLALRQPAAAVAPLERGLQILHTRPTAPVVVASVELDLAKALWDGKGDRTRARELAGSAKAAFCAAGEAYAPECKDAGGWLAAR